MPGPVTGNTAMEVGFFGKLPSHGDFMSRRLPRHFTEPWDRWLQSVIASSKQQLGDRWLDIYLTSPLWRFVTTAGVCGEGVWAGVLMPSVDRVGRYFPFTLAASMPVQCSAIAIISEGVEWFEALEELALRTLEDRFDLNVFEQDLIALKSPSISLSPTQAQQQRSGKPAWHVTAPSDIDTAHTLRGLNQILLNKLLPAHSLWWSQGSQRVEPSLLIAEGLPPVECFAGLLDGEWSRWGWGDYRLPLRPVQKNPSQEMDPENAPGATIEDSRSTTMEAD